MRRRKYLGDNPGGVLVTTQVVGTPQIIGPSDAVIQQAQGLLQSVPQVQYTQYITVGDEPADSVMTVDLSKSMTPDSYNTLSQNLRFILRSHLQDFMTQYILVSVDPQYSDIIKKAVINLFNTVNLDEVNSRQISPWQWEQIKMEAYEGQTPVTGISQNYSQLLGYDSIKDQALTTRYSKLLKLADLGLEIQRQAAILGLLSQAEYDAVDQIITSYEQVTPEVAKVLSDPVTLSAVALTQDPATIGA